jgi:glycosyltransferase involved in cell wall biosynthesis
VRQVRISVIIPVFNAAWSLREAVESVALRRATYTTYETEIIAIDDASSDGSWQVIEELEREGLLQYKGKFPENRGPAAARNEALGHATGAFVAFLDADDVRVEGSLIRQAESLAGQPEIEAIIGRAQIQRLQAGTSTFLDDGPPALILFLGSGLFRRELFSVQRCGLFDEKLSPAEDADWLLRAREKGVNFCLDDEVACRYRRHGANLTANKSVNERFFLNALRESLRRRRARGLSAAPLPPWSGIMKR